MLFEIKHLALIQAILVFSHVPAFRCSLGRNTNSTTLNFFSHRKQRKIRRLWERARVFLVWQRRKNHKKFRPKIQRRKLNKIFLHGFFLTYWICCKVSFCRIILAGLFTFWYLFSAKNNFEALEHYAFFV